TEPPVDIMTKLRPDLSSADSWLIGELRYAVVLELPAVAKSLRGAVFESPDGRGFTFSAASTLDEVKLGPGERIFEVRPRWSLPDDEWVSRNPDLWRLTASRPPMKP